MASSTAGVEEVGVDARPWPRLERIALVTLALAGYAAYFVLSARLMSVPARSLATDIDRRIPLVAGWVYIYCFVYLMTTIPIVFIRHRALFRRVVFAALLIQLVAFSVYLAWPVRYDLRPADIAADTFTDWGVRLVFHLDPPNGVFPSLHVGFASFVALCCWKVDRPVGVAVSLLATAISISTLYVKQHFLADVIAGAALGALAFALVVAPLRLDHVKGGARRYPRAVIALPLVAYTLAVLGLYVAYRTGWRPWQANT